MNKYIIITVISSICSMSSVAEEGSCQSLEKLECSDVNNPRACEILACKWEFGECIQDLTCSEIDDADFCNNYFGCAWGEDGCQVSCTDYTAPFRATYKQECFDAGCFWKADTMGSGICTERNACSAETGSRNCNRVDNCRWDEEARECQLNCRQIKDHQECNFHHEACELVGETCFHRANCHKTSIDECDSQIGCKLDNSDCIVDCSVYSSTIGSGAAADACALNGCTWKPNTWFGGECS